MFRDFGSEIFVNCIENEVLIGHFFSITMKSSQLKISIYTKLNNRVLLKAIHQIIVTNNLTLKSINQQHTSWPCAPWPSPDASGNPCKTRSLCSCQGFGYWSDSGRAQNSADAAVGEQDCSGQREIAPKKYCYLQGSETEFSLRSKFLNFQNFITKLWRN
ncbi:MAG: hypothetical protein Q4F57_02730 [Weeksellaceae bacterium]|nr:hypothetical protein [Weeksellaceae bacterium]